MSETENQDSPQSLEFIADSLDEMTPYEKKQKVSCERWSLHDPDTYTSFPTREHSSPSCGYALMHWYHCPLCLPTGVDGVFGSVHFM